MHRTHALIAAALFALSLSPASAAAAGPEGPCATPRRAMHTLLYWLQPERHDPSKAAACIDLAALDDAGEATTRAIQLKRVLDARGLYVDLDALPDEADYVDAASRQPVALPTPRDLPQLKLVRKGDRWLFAAESVAAVPGWFEATFPSALMQLVEQLPAPLRASLLGVAVWQLIGLLLLIFVAVLFAMIAVRVVGQWLHGLVGRVGAAWLDRALLMARGPVGGFSVAAVLHYGIPPLQLPVLLSRVLVLGVKVLFVSSLIWFLWRLVDMLAAFLEGKAEGTDSRLDDQLVPMVRKSLKVVLVTIGFLFALQNVGVNVGSLVAGLGIGGLAMALAAKDTLANLFGSIVVFIDRPFQIGDFVTIQGLQGTVEEVGFRTTRLRTPDGTLITVPNMRMSDSSIENLGARPWRRYRTTLGLTYDTPPERVEAFCEGLRELLAGLPERVKQDSYLVRFVGFGASTLDVLLQCHLLTREYAIEQEYRNDLNLEILRLAERVGVSFAFPSQSVYVESLPPATPSRVA